MYLQSMSNFRAIAIIMIVLGHMYAFGLRNLELEYGLIKNVITGGTALFVFISGYMFHHVFYFNFKYLKFIKSKLKNVIVPYFLLTTLAVFLHYNLNTVFFQNIEDISINEINKVYSPGSIFISGEHDLLRAFKMYLTGSSRVAYWYVPFVFLLFLISPLHHKYIRLNKSNQIIILFVFCFLSLFIHRGDLNDLPIHNLIYYTSFYLLGIIFSLNKDVIKGKTKNLNIIFCAFLFIILVMYETLILNHVGNYTNVNYEYLGVDIKFIQKILMIYVLYSLLTKYEFNNFIVNKISETSFAIFFIHGWVISIANRLFPYDGSNIFVYLAFTFIVIFICVLISMLIKMTIGSRFNTRCIIGY